MNGNWQVDAVIGSVLEAEGGAVRHENEGEWTNFGIRQSTLDSFFAWFVRQESTTTRDYRHFPPDVQEIDVDNARQIYRWYLTGAYPGLNICDLQLPDGGMTMMAIAGHWAVMSGHRAAAKGLQRTLNDVGGELAVDGIVGPLTLGTYKLLLSYQDPELLLAQHYAMHWRDKLAAIADADPDLYGQFRHGWLRRAAGWGVWKP